MSKCQETQGLEELAVCLLRDIHDFLPTTSLEVERDVLRLSSLVKDRGIGFLTLTLPEAGKRFDRALALGRLDPLCLPGFRPIGGNVSIIIPSFLRGIWSRIFGSDGLLCEEPCVTSIACLRQFFYCFKKVRLDCDAKRITETIEEFYRVDSSLRLPSLDWDGGCFDDRARSDLHLGGESEEHGDYEWDACIITDAGSYSRRSVLETIQRSLDGLAASLGEFVAEEWRAKHGSGAVSDGRVGKFDKYDFPTWSDRLEAVFPCAQFGFANYDHWVDWVRRGGTRATGTYCPRDAESRLITVPKTMKGPRLIASEPTSNQYCQQAILRYLVERTASSPLGRAIAFNDQTFNQDLALTASRTGTHATIDLSSASDCVSMWLVERAFRTNPGLLQALAATRTAVVADNISQPPRKTKLRKFTTMGAATTFPVQSIIYASIAIGVACVVDNLTFSLKTARQVASSIRVFGDDIIIPNRHAQLFVQVLNYLGFMVNPAKTFLEGNFRESCGMDAYDGVDVTPAYILEQFDELRPSSIESVRQSSNNLFLKGLWRTSEQLLQTLPSKVSANLPVVGVGSGFPGLTSFCGSRGSSLKRRWNPTLQRFECLTYTVANRAGKQRTEGPAALLRYFSEAPHPSTMLTWENGYEQRPRLVVQTRWVAEELIIY